MVSKFWWCAGDKEKTHIFSLSFPQRCNHNGGKPSVSHLFCNCVIDKKTIKHWKCLVAASNVWLFNIRVQLFSWEYQACETDRKVIPTSPRFLFSFFTTQAKSCIVLCESWCGIQRFLCPFIRSFKTDCRCTSTRTRQQPTGSGLHLHFPWCWQKLLYNMSRHNALSATYDLEDSRRWAILRPTNGKNKTDKREQEREREERKREIKYHAACLCNVHMVYVVFCEETMMANIVALNLA